MEVYILSKDYLVSTIKHPLNFPIAVSDNIDKLRKLLPKDAIKQDISMRSEKNIVEMHAESLTSDNRVCAFWSITKHNME